MPLASRQHLAAQHRIRSSEALDRRFGWRIPKPQIEKVKLTIVN
ncbi:hypothetical protein RMSM_02948 [Rhodopirellula maiorica SM1]|uniref:Uncharacterized protein n=1 Tax=Rhodopirellula maiorica SM1 TaxID=1265738 RepID=M5RLN6_9BACT|nr:hypothetical protein RMSM_02948 [Rhodopirellula maiorica SM1]